MAQLKRALTACMLSVLVPHAAARAATFYVAPAPAGDNTNPGTAAEPWRTIAHAVNTMEAGDTTYVRGGTYEEGYIQFKRSGTEAKPIKLLNAPGESPIIDCIDASKFHRILVAHSSGPLNPMGWITVEGFEIRHCYEAFKIISGHDLTIRRNWIHHNKPGSGIYGNGTRVVFDRNIINHNANIEECEAGTAPCKPGGHGIYFHGTDITITNNVIYDNLSFGVQLNGSTASSTYNPNTDPGPEFAVSEDWLIAHNTFAYNRRAAGVVVWGATCNRARIENNVFYENAAKNSNATQGVHFTSTTCTGVKVNNNLFYASGSGGAKAFGSGATEGLHYTQANNIINVSAPGFVDAPATLTASPNFALATAQSPAVDAGLPLASVTVDFNGVPRPQGLAPDMGAYEYAVLDDVAPSSPTGITVR